MTNTTTTTTSPRDLNTSRSSTSLSPQSTGRLPKHQSSRDRIEQILEGARERAESLDQTDPGSINPGLRPLLASSPSPHTALPPDLDDSHHGGGYASESIVTTQPTRQPSLNYLSTAQTAPNSTRRRSIQPKKSFTTAGVERQDQAPSQPLVASGAAGCDSGDSQSMRGSTNTGQKEESRWKRTLRYFKSIELENKGSVARDHLALERTFLAWLRTSLAFASIGIAITQLFRLNTSLEGDSKRAESLRHLGKPLGTIFLAISILILLLGYNRYLQGQYWVIRGKFPASRGTIILVAFIAFAVTLASLIVILALQSP